MANPIAYFGYSKNGLEIAFNNLSLNNPTSQQWDFGDGNNSSDKNPTHTYSEPGFYTITLTVSKVGSEDSVQTIKIGVGDSNDMVNKTLPELILLELPVDIIDDQAMDTIMTLIQKWQLHLQPMVVEPEELPVEYTHNEFKWPGLVNLLIAKLVSYDFIIINATKYVTNPTGNTIRVSINAETKKKLKSIETGPAKTEFYEQNDYDNTLKLARAYQAICIKGGLLTEIKQSTCMLASRVNIYLSICGNSRNHIFPPSTQ